jgi:flagellar hook-length control protein FliK
VVSVTSEIASNLSFQSSLRAQKSDAPPANDSFASLVDSNNAAADNNRAGDSSSPPSNNSSAPRRPDDTAAKTGAARDNSAADKPTTTTNNNNKGSADRDTAAVEQANGNTDAKPEQAKPKTSAAKADDTKSEVKADSGETPATDADATETKQDVATIAVTVDAVAVAIPVAVVPVENSATPATGNTTATAPLPIAAAAIATTAAVTGAASDTIQDNAAGAATPATVAAAATADADATAAATANETVTAGLQTASTDAAVATDVALAAFVAAPVVAKPATASKTSPAVKDTTAKTGEQEVTTGTTEASVNTATAPAVAVDATQPAAPTGKLGAEHRSADALKPDAAAGASESANAAARTHSAGPDTAAQTSVNSPTNDLPTVTTVQPQLQPAAVQATSQFTVTAATPTAAVPLSGLAMEIAVTAKSGKSRFEIRLDPADLGRIDVRIDVDRNGQVTSHLTVEKPETLSMLRQDATQLQRALNDAGLSTSGGGLQFSLRDQSQSGQNDQNQSNPNAQRLIVAEEEVVPAAVAGRSYGRMFGPSGGVDIRV